MKFFSRRSQGSSQPAGTGSAASSSGSRGKGLRRLVSAILLLGLLAAFTRPGKKATRSIARRLDARVECFTEPGSSSYVRIFAPIFGRLYVSVASDVVRELKARGGTRSGTRGATIVDLGCGPGDLVVEISRRVKDARITGLDLSPSMLLWAGRHATTDGRIKFLVGDAVEMPFDDASVDMVVSTLSMHHWDDPSGVFAEIDRVLRPGGVALIYDLGLLAYTPEEMGEVASAAGLEPDDIVRERAPGGLISTFFVRYKMEGMA